jgi:heme exporter protein A
MTEASTGSVVQPVIQVNNLHKTFGMLEAVAGISFELEQGSFLTVFGPNGAGKTTLIKILSGLTKPTHGSASVAGYDILSNDPQMRRNIGVISHASCLYRDLSALENLIFYAKMYGLDHVKDRAVKALDEVGLKARMYDSVQSFSRGMQQRVSIARGVIHNPSVLFLDEPFTGLDPHGSIVLKNFLHSLRSDKRTIIMTTHDLDCGLEMGDKVAIQAKGRFALFEDKANISQENFEEFYFKIIDENGPGPKMSKTTID